MKKAIDLSKILTEVHERKWVALSRDYRTVIGSSESLSALKKIVGTRDVVYMKVPPSDIIFAY